jgi:hypothetical protein
MKISQINQIKKKQTLFKPHKQGSFKKKKKKKKVYLPSLMMKVPDHVYILG